MSQVEIITLPADQWQRYREIRLEALREEPQAFSSSHADVEQRPPDFWQGRLAEAARRETSWLLFAQAGGRLVGMIGAFVDQEPGTAQIISVYVCHAARGKGVGKALMEAILAEVRKMEGIRKAALDVNRRQTAALALYRRMGFEVVGEKESKTGDGQMALEYVMEKRLY
jgi:ribosomal protein S18 acetylase RimI-like enzyme